MPFYSSSDLLNDWRYAVKEEFTTANGESYPYAENGRLQWGDEIKKLTFKQAPRRGCVSDDGSRLAVVIDDDIYLINTQTWSTDALLKGHTEDINAVAFKPNDANALVSSADPHSILHNENAQPVVIIWDVEKDKSLNAPDENLPSDVACVAASAAAEKLAKLGVNLKEEGLHGLTKAFEPIVDRTIVKHMAADKSQVHGRLQTHFQSQIFSPSGKWMVYLPGKRPRSNKDAWWDIVICFPDSLKTHLTLTGHSDAIMWTGWSLDETHFASVAWDGSIRIWDAVTGHEKHRFETSKQNWTGAFTPDSKYFAAIDGLGTVRVYSMISDNPVHWVYEAERAGRWRRTIDWHPNSKWLAVGGESSGELLLLDVEEKRLLQRRELSIEESRPSDETTRSIIKRFVGTSEVKFVDGGNKLAVWTYGDWSIEVYDINQQVKWRFARGGTEDGPEASKWRDNQGKVTSGPGSGMLVWQDLVNRQLRLASLDFDGVRIWAVPLTA